MIHGRCVRQTLRDPIDRKLVRSINKIGHLKGRADHCGVCRESKDHSDAHQPRGGLRPEGYGAAQSQRALKSAVAYQANANRIERSTARMCLVMLPIEM